MDLMTYRGHLLPVTRHGINRRGTGPLMPCSYEETVDMLTQAAAHAETDYLRGVSENLVVGNLAPLGTASFELMLNTEMLKDAVEYAPPDGVGMGVMGHEPGSPAYRNFYENAAFSPSMVASAMSPM